MSAELLYSSELSPSELSFERQQALYRLKGIEVDVFGVPVAQAERYEPGVVRVIPITDEILAAEAAAQAARQTDREKLTWHMPEPLPDSAYRSRPGKRRVRRAAAPKPPRTPKVAPSPAPPAQVHKEEPPMEKHPEEKTCIVAGCDAALKPNNQSGRCAAHPYLKRGTTLKDGTIIGGDKKTNTPGTRTPTNKKHVTAAAPSLAKRGSTETTIDAITGGAGVVLIPVPEQMLTDFWLRLDVADKVRIIAAELQRGL